jgi:hypothetical protein
MNNIITNETFNRWFSSNTDCDSQLKNVIDTNKFEKKIPTFKDISNTLFRCDNLYDNYIYPQNLNNIGVNTAHFSEKTLNIIINKLGYTPKFGIEVGSFIGSSAVILGNLLKKNNGVLLCVDTWCGDINMW